MPFEARISLHNIKCYTALYETAVQNQCCDLTELYIYFALKLRAQ